MEEFRLLQAVFHLTHSRAELNSLQKIRRNLQQRVRNLVDQLGNQMGEEFVRLGLERYNGNRWPSEQEQQLQVQPYLPQHKYHKNKNKNKIKRIDMDKDGSSKQMRKKDKNKNISKNAQKNENEDENENEKEYSSEGEECWSPTTQLKFGGKFLDKRMLYRRASYKKLSRNDDFSSLPEDVQQDLALDQFI